MADCAVNLLLDKLVNIFESEVQQLGKVWEDVVIVRAELERMRAFVRIADAIEERDDELKVWLKQVRDVAHDTEDVLDEYNLQQTHHEHHSGIIGSLCKLSCCIKNTKARFRIANDLKVISSRIKDIAATHKRLHHKLSVAQTDVNSTHCLWYDRRGDALLLDKTDLVGIDEPKRELVGWLVKGSSAREIVAIAGMGGIGKTTLTKQVYDDPEVKKHFKLCLWLTVSQSFKVGDLLKEMVQKIFRVIRRPIPEDVDVMTNDSLKTKIKEMLQKRRYLIVLDDVWHLHEWDFVKIALPNNSYGSRVMLTTRNSDVALTSSMESDGKVYNLKTLSSEESWDLFCCKTFKGNTCPPHLEEVCKFILRRCEGLPLAIVAISGVLATKDKRRIDQWDMVGHCLGAEIEVNDKLKVLKKVLLLSFNDLPYHLKSCFLYLSIFHEDHQIKHTRLIRLWIAEGFVEAKEGKTLEDVAEEYLNELLNRSLIQIAEIMNDGRVKRFRIHDLLREIIISKSRDQNFATIAKDHNTLWPDKVRRLAVHNTVQNVPQNRSLSHLRSLFMFNVAETPSLHSLLLGGSTLLKVLDMKNAMLKKFPTEIVCLYHMKYLCLSNTKIKVVPSFIGKLQNLEFLELKNTYVTELPDEILMLKRLRHLLVYRCKYISYSSIKYGFKIQGEIGTLGFLQKLCFIDADRCASNILSELGKLNQLRRLGIINLRKKDGKALCSSIEMLNNLLAMSLTAIQSDEILDLQHISSPPLLLQRLYLRGKLNMLPHWIPCLSGLVRLYLKSSRLNEDPLVSLQSLPNLVHLELCEVFDGDTLCFRTGGFKKLKIIGLDKMDELRCIQVEMGAMPCVEKLSMQRCKLLEKVPSGIEHLKTLKVLEFFDMPKDIIMSLCLDKHGNDFWRVAHIPEVYSTYWREGGWEVYSLEGFNDGEISPCPCKTVIMSQELQTRWK